MTKERRTEILWMAFLGLMVAAFCTFFGVTLWKGQACREEREVLQDLRERRLDLERKQDERRDWMFNCIEGGRYDAYESKWHHPTVEACLERRQSVEAALASEQPRLVQQ